MMKDAAWCAVAECTVIAIVVVVIKLFLVIKADHRNAQFLKAAVLCLYVCGYVNIFLMWRFVDLWVPLREIIMQHEIHSPSSKILPLKTFKLYFQSDFFFSPSCFNQMHGTFCL